MPLGVSGWCPLSPPWPPAARFVGENGEAPGTEMPPGTQCIATTYDAPTQHFVLYHNDPVEYGWHVLELQVSGESARAHR